jgi:hypothetical protein
MAPIPANPRDAMLAAMAGAALAMDGGCSQDAADRGSNAPSAEWHTDGPRRYAYADRDAFIADTAASLARMSEAIDAQFPAIANAGAPDRSEPVRLVEGMRSRAAGVYRLLETAGTATAHEWPAITKTCSAEIRQLESDAASLSRWIRDDGRR